MEQIIWKYILHIRNTSPLVHNITHYVVMNNTANAVLAVGASPIMSHARPEINDAVSIKFLPSQFSIFNSQLFTYEEI